MEDSESDSEYRSEEDSEKTDWRHESMAPAVTQGPVRKRASGSVSKRAKGALRVVDPTLLIWSGRASDQMLLHSFTQCVSDNGLLQSLNGRWVRRPVAQ